MSDERPFYTILGVPADATAAQIKAAYRKLVKMEHPDAGGDHARFIEITAAYNVLSDPEARLLYDESGDVDAEKQMTFQEQVIESVTSAFNATLDVCCDKGVDVDTIDFIKDMEKLVQAGIEILTKDQKKLKAVVASLKKLQGRILREGEGVNTFAEIIAKKMADAQAELMDADHSLRIASRVAEECRSHKDTNSLIRTVQAGRYKSEIFASDFGKWREAGWGVVNLDST